MYFVCYVTTENKMKTFGLFILYLRYWSSLPIPSKGFFCITCNFCNLCFGLIGVPLLPNPYHASATFVYILLEAVKKLFFGNVTRKWINKSILSPRLVYIFLRNKPCVFVLDYLNNWVKPWQEWRRSEREQNYEQWSEHNFADTVET